MSDQIIHEYHGQKISFDERREEWKVVMDEKEQYHKNLKVIKNYIDSRNKKKFDRVPVFVEKGSSYSSHFNQEHGYEKAVITSVGVDGTIFVVRQGTKYAEHCGTAYIQDAKNKKLIEEIVTLHKARNEADKKLRAAKDKLVEVDFDALRKKALSE